MEQREQVYTSGPITVVASLVLASVLATFAQGADNGYEPPLVPGHDPIEPGEHPRLIVRKGEEQATVLKTARGEWGRNVVYRLNQSLKLMAKATITGRNRDVIKEAGYKAAGQGAVYTLEGSAAAAAAARKTVLTEVIAFPMKSSLPVMDRISRLHGTAIAYDLCYDAWNETTRATVRVFMRSESQALLKRAGGTAALRTAAPEPVAAYATAGLAELAMLRDAGDDPAARKRIDGCEQAVIDYLRDSVDDRGFGIHGESVKQAAFASGILPFVYANRLVRGRDLIGHPAVSAVMVPMVYQTVPAVGMAIIGPGTVAKNRSGLFAMAARFVPEHERPAVAWLFHKVGGDAYYGVVRPHQALYMLGSGLDRIEAAAPGEDWPWFIRSDQVTLGVFRTRWQDADDIVAILHDGAVRILGMGARWVSRRGLHANRWSDDPGVGAMENVLGFHTRMYRTSVERTVSRFKATDAAGLGSITVTVKGRADRITSSVTMKKKIGGTKVEVNVPVPPAGAFEGVRAFGVDYTGLSGVPALFALVDTLTGAGEAPRQWVLHAGYRCRFTVEGSTFTITSGDATLCGTAVFPKDLVFAGESHPPYTNFIHAETTSPHVHVIMTLQRGAAPAVSAPAGGLAGTVKVGERGIGFSDNTIVFAD